MNQTDQTVLMSPCKKVDQTKIKYLRHKNGNGKIYDDAEVCERSYLDKFSDVSGDDSSVWSSNIKNSRIINSLIRNAVIKTSHIEASDISGGIIENSTILTELITGNPLIENSTILGFSKIAHSAKIINCSIKDLTVKGNAQILNWGEEIFDGKRGYISRGIWTKPPRVYRTSFGVTLTESVFDKDRKFAFVACREKPVKRWLEIGDRYGSAQGWSSEQIGEVREMLTSWL